MELESGKYLVKKAREAISAFLQGEEEPEIKGFKSKRGVFVTLETYPERELRGCIGFPEPVLPLGEGVLRAAVSAATQDPRFPPLSPEELESIVIEISVLTKPKMMSCPAGKRPGEVAIGEDGLIAQCGDSRGLLLPQVPVDQDWGENKFLCQTCVKAGLPSDSWEKDDVDIYKFQAEIFSEKTPHGEVEKRETPEKKGKKST